MESIPEGLNEREYAMYALENGIGRPATKANLELIASCIKSLSKTKGMSLQRAMQYLIRAVKLANEQGVDVDYGFFSDAVYLKMRPKTPLPQYKPMTKEYWEETKRQQSGPEWDELKRKFDEVLKGMTMPSTGGKK